MLINGECLSELAKLPDKSVDLFYMDLPYGETNCKWDIKIDMKLLWKELWRLSRHKRVAYIFSCSTKFGYNLIKSWEKGFKMDLVLKKRNKTGGIYSRYRPMKNHEMVYFFYRKAPKYNRDKYHKRIKQTKKVPNKKEPDKTTPSDKYKSSVYGVNCKEGFGATYNPPNPASVIETEPDKNLPNSFKTENVDYKKKEFGYRNSGYKDGGGARFDPPNPVSIFASKKVFIGKRHHQTQKPLDLMEFLLKYWTDENDVVLDPTMGSGSMGVMCKRMGRKFIGIEKDPEIFKIAQKRIEGEKWWKKENKVLVL